MSRCIRSCRQTPDWDSHSYWATITRSANATGGSAPRCSTNVRAAFDELIWMMYPPPPPHLSQWCTPYLQVRAAFDAMVARGASAAGRAALAKTFRLCPATPVGGGGGNGHDASPRRSAVGGGGGGGGHGSPVGGGHADLPVVGGGDSPLRSAADVARLYKLMVFTFDTLSMGNYPHASQGQRVARGGAILSWWSIQALIRLLRYFASRFSAGGLASRRSRRVWP